MRFRLLPLLAAAVLSNAAHADRWVLSSARSTGKNGAFFITDVRLLNASNTDSATVHLVYYPSGGAPVTSSEVTILPRRQKALDNVLESVFGFTSNTFGPIRVVANDSVQVSSRTYNVTDPCSGGTFGSALPGVDAEAAVTSGLVSQVSGSADPSSGSRTNLIVTNPSAAGAHVTVKLRTGDE